MYKAYKFRIYPNKEQEVLLAKTFGCARFIYNQMLADKIEHYKKTGQMLRNNYPQYKDENPWLSEVDSRALANARINLERAYTNFFKDPNIGFPKFKSKRSSRKSYTTNCINNNIRLEKGFLRLPKLGMVKIKQHRPIPEGHVLKSVTVSQDPSGKYFASILFFYEKEVEKISPESFLGLKQSATTLYKDSEGFEPAYPRYYRQAEKRIKREQRKLSLMKKGSNNYEKQRIKLAKLHEKVKNQRKDFLHKESRRIADSQDLVCIQNLDLKVIEGDSEYNKDLYDSAWDTFTTYLDYKLGDQGKNLLKISKSFESTELCSSCGFKNEEIKDLPTKEWTCPACKSRHNRDLNAAINIRNEGLRLCSKDPKT